MHGSHPYAIKNQRKARNAPSRAHFVPKPLVEGFRGLKLVLYGIRVLAEQHYDQDSTNEIGEDWSLVIPGESNQSLELTLCSRVVPPGLSE